MIDVAKIVVRERVRGNSWDDTNTEESVRISMSVQGIYLQVNKGDLQKLTPEQALEVGQYLLKSAEIQSEYAEAITKIDEERKKVEASYKDMVSGLGLDVEVDVNNPRNTIVVTAGELE